MKTRKLAAMFLALIMVLALVPAASLAEGIEKIADEAAAMHKLDSVWADLEAAEAEALANGMDRFDVINAVYTAALNNVKVDKDSFSDFSKDGFYFTVDGMYNAYNFRLRNELDTDCAPVAEDEFIITIEGKGAAKDAEAVDVLLVAPYYGHDSSFTDQYKVEAQSIADATGGSYTLIQSTGATGPVIAENYLDKAVVIYDSHGTQSGTSTYLCLTTNAGITTEDYNNGWAVRAGSAAYIDGRYIEHHVAGTLANTFVWMAICEGMKRNGYGTTGTALLNAGAGVVYGYSQSVTFAGDYVYEETFWNEMKNGANTCDAFATMKDEHGVPDPYGDAYPIIMSEVDAFPSNPDSEQTVYTEWNLFGAQEPVALESFTLSETDLNLTLGQEANILFGRVPDNANAYELVWTSSDETVIAIEGNNRRCKVNAIHSGSAVVTCTVFVGEEIFGTATVNVTVTADQDLKAALNVEGGNLEFGTGGEYPFVTLTEDNRYLAKSSNAARNNSKSTLTLTIGMLQGETLTFEYLYGSENNFDFFNFKVNDSQVLHLSGTNNSNWNSYTYTAAADGLYTFTWEFTKDSSVNGGIDCVKIDNVEYSGDSSPVLLGDVNGDGVVDNIDAMILIRYTLGLIGENGIDLRAADMDGDGAYTSVDAVIIIRIALGMN